MTELSNRQSDILNIARASGRVTVEDLARRYMFAAGFTNVTTTAPAGPQGNDVRIRGYK